MQYPLDAALGASTGGYFSDGNPVVVVYQGATSWIDACEAPSVPGAAWDGGTSTWDDSTSHWLDALDCPPTPTASASAVGRFAFTPGLSTLSLSWLDLSDFFWFEPPGEVVDGVVVPPQPLLPGCTPPHEYAPVSCEPGCALEWDAGRSSWDGGAAAWACESPGGVEST